jgi:hypothetical protein
MRRAAACLAVALLAACERPVAPPNANSDPLGLGVTRSNAVIPNSGIWTKVPWMATSRKYAGAASAGGKVWVLGGVTTNVCTTTTAAFEVYDPQLNSWSTLPDMPVARAYAAVAAVGPTIYMVGGITACGISAEVRAYDTEHGTWRSLGETPVGDYAVTHARAVGVRGKLYIMGGNSSISPNNFLFVFDTVTKAWTQLANMPGRRVYGGAVAMGHTIYYVAGRDESGCITNSLYAYDIPTNSWSTLASAPTSRQGVSVGAVKGIVYVSGGADGVNAPVSATEAYDPAANTWTTVAAAPWGRRYSVGTSVGNVFYHIGGDDGSAPTSTFQAFRPASADNHAPHIERMGPGVGTEGATVDFQAQTYDVDGDALLFTWDFGDGSPVSHATGPQHTYADLGAYPVTLTVDDQHGETATVQRYITINSVAPVITMTPSADTVIIVGESVHFAGSFTDVGSSSWIAGYQWSDGPVSLLSLSGQTFDLPRTFDEPGIRTVLITIDDGSGGVGKARRSVQILPVQAALRRLRQYTELAGEPFTSALGPIAATAAHKYSNGKYDETDDALIQFKAQVDVLVGGGANAVTGAALKAWAQRCIAQILIT